MSSGKFELSGLFLVEGLSVITYHGEGLLPTGLSCLNYNDTCCRKAPSTAGLLPKNKMGVVTRVEYFRFSLEDLAYKKSPNSDLGLD